MSLARDRNLELSRNAKKLLSVRKRKTKSNRSSVETAGEKRPGCDTMGGLFGNTGEQVERIAEDLFAFNADRVEALRAPRDDRLAALGPVVLGVVFGLKTLSNYYEWRDREGCQRILNLAERIHSSYSGPQSPALHQVSRNPVL